MIHITCRLTAKNRDQLRNPTLGNRVWAAVYLIPIVGAIASKSQCVFVRPVSRSGDRPAARRGLAAADLHDPAGALPASAAAPAAPASVDHLLVVVVGRRGGGPTRRRGRRRTAHRRRRPDRRRAPRSIIANVHYRGHFEKWSGHVVPKWGWGR